MSMVAKNSAWHDSMYNNRALVPNHAEHFANWAQTSADARKSLKCLLDIPYGQGLNETLDIFPAKQPNAPVEAGYQHSIANIMTNAACRTGAKVTFDEKTQEVMANGKVFKY
jgi:hypothetical protein